MAIIGQYALGLSGGTDTSGNGNNLTPANSPTTAISHDGVTVNGASVFNGTNQYFAGTAPEVTDPFGTYSFSTWIQDNGGHGVPLAIVDKFFLQTDGANISIAMYYAPGSFTSYNIIPVDTDLHHIVVSIDGTNLKVYADTVLEVDVTLATGVWTTSNDLVIGALSPSIFFFDGSVDDTIFYDDISTQADVDILFAAPDLDAVSSITIVDKVDNEPLQVNLLEQATITKDLTYLDAGVTPTGIEARFNQTGAESWTLVDASPSGGTSSLTLPDTPGGHGTLEVRFTNDISINDSVDMGLGHIIIPKGQSNSNGKLTNPTVYTGTQPCFIWKTDGTSWEAMVEPCSPENEGSGVYTHYPRLCNIIEAETDLPVYIIDTAWGGTGLVDGTPNTPGDWSDGGMAYDRAVQIINDSGVTEALCSIWFQGYNDQVSAITQSAYETQLPITLAGLRTDTGLTTLGTVVTSLMYGNDIRAAHLSFNDGHESFMYPGAVTSDINLDVDPLHLKKDTDSEAYCQRTWAMIKAAFLNGTATRGPVMDSVALTAEADEALVTWDAVGPLLDARIDDYTAEDDSGSLTILSVVIQDSIKTLVTFNRALSTNPILSFGNGTDYYGGTFRDSQTDIPAFNPANYGAPAEPFIDEPIIEIIQVNPNVGIIEIVGLDPVVSAPQVLNINTGVIEVVGFNPVIDTSTLINPLTGTIEIIGFNPVISTPISLDLNAGEINIIGFNPTISYSGVKRPPSSRIFVVPFDNRT